MNRLSVQTKEVPTTETVVDSATCDNCGAALVPVFPDQMTRPQFNDSLTIQVSGGYGEFIDGGGTAYWCKSCTTSLFNAFPSLAKVIRLVGGWYSLVWRDGKFGVEEISS